MIVMVPRRPGNGGALLSEGARADVTREALGGSAAPGLRDSVRVRVMGPPVAGAERSRWRSGPPP